MDIQEANVAENFNRLLNIVKSLDNDDDSSDSDDSDDDDNDDISEYAEGYDSVDRTTPLASTQAIATPPVAQQQRPS